MKRAIFRKTLICLFCFSLLPVNVPAKADKLTTDVNLIVIGIVAVGAAIGVGIFFAFHHASSIKGCAASGQNGLEITNNGDHLTYLLAGITDGVKPGDIVKVKGKKKSAKGSAAPTFVVHSFSKDYGACSATLRKP